jgi:DNA-binding transcriptional MerR regulator
MDIREIKFEPLINKPLEEIMNNNLFELVEFVYRINEEQFSIKEVDISHREILHWEEEELIEKRNKEKESWRRYSFFEYVWLRMIKELRSFGISIPLIKKIKDSLFSKIDGALIQQVNEDQLAQIKKSFKGAKDDKKLKEVSIASLKKEAASVQHLSLLTIIVLEIIFSRCQAYLLVNSKSEFGIALLNKLSLEQKIDALHEQLAKGSLLSINIFTIIEEFYLSTKFSRETHYKLTPLSRQEREIVEIIRSERISSIKIDLKEGGEFYVEISRKKPTEAAEKQVLEIISKGNHNRITIEMADGKVLSFTETKKRKIK